jgi:hypothetical protein
MTKSELLRLVLRRWYLMVLGAAVSVGVLFLATHQPGVYWTQFNVVLLPPENADHPNYLENPRYRLQPMVGVVVNDINKSERPLLTASSDTTLVGMGVRRGVQLRVPNQGNQWQPVFDANHVDVQIADDTPEAVSRRAKQVVRQISAALDVRQDELGIVPTMRISALANTDDPTIYYVAGSRMRAAAGTAVAGAVGTTILVYWLERWRLWRRHRATAVPA